MWDSDELNYLNASTNKNGETKVMNKRLGLISICLSVIAVCAVMWIGIGERAQQAPNEDAYSRVIRGGTIRVGYISYPPSFIKDANTGEYSGIFHDVLARVAEDLSLRVEYTEELGWGTMVEAVSSERVDLACTGIWPTAGRARRAEFSTPIYFSTVKAYVDKGDTRFDGDLSLVNKSDVRIASIDGEMTTIIARTDFPRATETSLPQSADVSQVLLEIISGKADITFVEVAIAQAFLEKNPGSIREVQDVAPLRVFPNVMMVGKGEYRLLSMLNVAIEVLANSGELERIIAKYEEYAGSFQRRQIPYLPKP